MIDVVLTLCHQGHRVKSVYHLSWHGLLPLPHADHPCRLSVWKVFADLIWALPPKHMRTKSEKHMKNGGDWRAIMNAMRARFLLYGQMQGIRKKQFH